MFGRAFELLEADEYTYTYMENNKHIFTMADADAILKSLRVQVIQLEQLSAAQWPQSQLQN